MCVCVYILGASKWMLRPTLKNLGQFSLARRKPTDMDTLVPYIRYAPFPLHKRSPKILVLVWFETLFWTFYFALLCFLAVGIDSPFSPFSPICRSFPILAGGWAYLS